MADKMQLIKIVQYSLTYEGILEPVTLLLMIS